MIYSVNVTLFQTFYLINCNTGLNGFQLFWTSSSRNDKHRKANPTPALAAIKSNTNRTFELAI